MKPGIFYLVHSKKFEILVCFLLQCYVVLDGCPILLCGSFGSSLYRYHAVHAVAIAIAIWKYCKN